MRFYLRIIITQFFIFFGVALSGQPSNEAILVNNLFREYANAESPGYAVSIYKDREIVYSAGFGLANLEYGIPITPRTIFHVASVSKQFTCFAILLLEQKGHLRLDDDIRKYIPELPDYGNVITLRHLMNHSSGVRDQWQLLAMAGWRLDDVITKDQILKLVLSQRELNFEPGSEYLYSNSGYSLLARIVERVSGISFAEYCKREIFDKLGMTGTHVHDDHQEIVPGRAYSYYPEGDKGYRKAILSYANDGATSLFTTAEDLTKWVDNMLTGSYGKEIIEGMHRPGLLNSGDTLTYGLGLGINTYKGLRYAGHGGADAGFRSHIRWYPEHDVGIVVLSNLGSAIPGEMVDKITDIYLDEFIKVPENDGDETEKVEDIPLSVSELKKFTGAYTLTEVGLKFDIELKEDQLILKQEWDGSEQVILPYAGNKFYGTEDTGLLIEFIWEGGEIGQVLLNNKGDSYTAEKVKDPNKNPVSFSKFTGTYYSPELKTTYWIRNIDKKLIVSHSRHPDFELHYISGTKFRANLWWFNRVEFVIDNRGQIEGFLVNAGRVKNLKFEKTD